METILDRYRQLTYEAMSLRIEIHSLKAQNDPGVYAKEAALMRVKDEIRAYRIVLKNHMDKQDDAREYPLLEKV
jgi:hypothetical protein